MHKGDQTHRKTRLHRIDLHEDHVELCIEDTRERRSHLATSYGPKVCGELLTHHRRGNGVDEEVLRVRIPPPAGHQNVPQMGSCGDRSLRRRKSIFVDLSRGLRFFGDL